MRTSHLRGAPLSHAILYGEDGLPQALTTVDGIGTGLNDLGFALIRAGFKGIRWQCVDTDEGPGKVGIVWQARHDTPDGAYFARVVASVQFGQCPPSFEQACQDIARLTAVAKWTAQS